MRTITLPDAAPSVGRNPVLTLAKLRGLPMEDAAHAAKIGDAALTRGGKLARECMVAMDRGLGLDTAVKLGTVIASAVTRRNSTLLREMADYIDAERRMLRNGPAHPVLALVADYIDTHGHPAAADQDAVHAHVCAEMPDDVDKPRVVEALRILGAAASPQPRKRRKKALTNSTGKIR